MNPLLIIVLLSASVYSQTYNADSCGKRPFGPKKEDYARIVGGAEATLGDWPWACSMRFNGRHICGGSLINEEWIITAAHCVSSLYDDPSYYTWVCGAHNQQNPESWSEIYATDQVVKHPNYNAQYIQNDIALFKISTPAKYSNYILPACFPAAADTYEGSPCIATGWGSTSSGGSVVTNLREVSMPVLTDQECENRFDGGQGMLDPVTQVCAGEEGQNKDTCQGDSGGPLVVQHSDDNLWYIIGLTSWGYGCGDGGVYTRTSAFRSWVESFTGPLPTGK